MILSQEDQPGTHSTPAKLPVNLILMVDQYPVYTYVDL